MKIKIIKYSLHWHKELKRLIFYFWFFSASTLTAVWLVQPYLQTVELPLYLFWLIWSILNVSVWIFALYSHKFEKILWRKRLLISLMFMCFAWYILSAIFNELWAIVFLFLFYIPRWIWRPVIKDYINKIISSDIRATVLSIQWLVGRLSFAIISPFVWWMLDVYSLSYALLGAWIIFVMLGVISLLYMRKYKLI